MLGILAADEVDLAAGVGVARREVGQLALVRFVGVAGEAPVRERGEVDAIHARGVLAEEDGRARGERRVRRGVRRDERRLELPREPRDGGAALVIPIANAREALGATPLSPSSAP